jgi:hypothetical protein
VQSLTKNMLMNIPLRSWHHSHARSKRGSFFIHLASIATSQRASRYRPGTRPCFRSASRDFCTNVTITGQEHSKNLKL